MDVFMILIFISAMVGLVYYLDKKTKDNSVDDLSKVIDEMNKKDKE